MQTNHTPLQSPHRLMQFKQSQHLNPSRLKITRKSLFDSQQGQPSSTTHSASKVQFHSSFLQNVDPCEENRQLKLKLEQIKQMNRELLSTLTGKEREIDRVDYEFKQLQFRYKCQMQRANIKMRELAEEGFRTHREQRGSWVEEVEVMKRSPNMEKIRMMKESLEKIDFRGVERLATMPNPRRSCQLN